MPARLPKQVRKQIFERVYAEADSVGYLSQGRVENGLFMDRLVRNPQIGGVLCDFMDEGHVKTYIKDAILNRYSKDRAGDALECVSNEELLSKRFGPVVEIGHRDSVYSYSSVRLHDRYYVVSEGTCSKWETALRKALEYVSSLPPATKNTVPVIALKCSSRRGVLTVSDKELIESSLSQIGVEFYCIEF